MANRIGRLLSKNEIIRNAAIGRKADKVIRDLMLSAHDIGYKIHGGDTYAENRIIDPFSDEVASIKSIGPMGKRLQRYVSINDHRLVGIFEDICKKEKAVVCREYWGIGNEYLLFPNISPQDEKLLTENIHPYDGIKYVLQGQFSSIIRTEGLMIGTYGISSCRGYLVFDPNNGIAAVGHCDIRSADTHMILAMRDRVIQLGGRSTKLTLFTTDTIEMQLIDQIKSKFNKVKTDLYRDFIFDPKKNKIRKIDDNDLPRADDIDRNWQEKIGIRLDCHIPWVEVQ